MATDICLRVFEGFESEHIGPWCIDRGLGNGFWYIVEVDESEVYGWIRCMG